MTADLVNLRQARKRRQRDEKAARAEQNRIDHGRSRHEKAVMAKAKALEERRHAGGHIERADFGKTPDDEQ